MHLAKNERDPVLAQIRSSGVIDARGVVIAQHELRDLIADVGRVDPKGHRILKAGQFDQATLASPDFALVVFEDETCFAGAVFQGAADFYSAAFKSGADFDDATFDGKVTFRSSEFGGNALEARAFGVTRFQRVRFRGKTDFDVTDFVSGVSFGKATFEQESSFQTTRFVLVEPSDEATTGTMRETVGENASFVKSRFAGATDFAGARFQGHIASFEEAVFNDDAEFDEATFNARWVVFDAATFSKRVRIVARANGVSCIRSRFEGGAHISVERADVALEGGEFAQPSVLEFGPPSIFVRYPTPADESDRPRVVSLRWANVEHLTLHGLSLSGCRFFGAHNLDRLRIDADGAFAIAPRTWRHARREVIAEEWDWRIENGRWKGARPVEWPQRWTILSNFERGGPEPLAAHQIARIYRALRKAREDAKDEPGAADFYYGEMEMRRHAASEGSVSAGHRFIRWPERALLTLYWATSGYGLRASRAFAALVVTVLAFAALLYAIGLHDRDLSNALLQSAQGATLRGGDSRLLNDQGKGLQLAVRLLGPVLFGLGLLSLRGRLKR